MMRGIPIVDTEQMRALDRAAMRGTCTRQARRCICGWRTAPTSFAATQGRILQAYGI
jgi:hypothetical protein